MDIASAFALVVLSVGAFYGPNGLFFVSVALMNFGALAVLPTTLTGGVTLPAASIGMLAAAVLTGQRFGLKPLIAAAIDIRRLGLLTVFTLIVVIVTLVAPFLFGGEIYTYPIRSTATISTLAPIGYSSSNLTQAGYLVLSWLTAVMLSVLADQAGFAGVFRSAFMTLAFLLILTGILDMFGANAFLSLFRNASYALVGDTSIASSKRIVGAMPEASAYGSLAGGVFGIFILMRSCFTYRPIFFIATISTGVFTILSTSSTAYAMVVGVGLALALQVTLRIFVGKALEQANAIIEVGILITVLMAGLVVVSLSPDLINIADRLIDELVFRKALSSSYEERSRWTLAGWDAFLTSGGFGVGAGSARTSNGFVNILASSGLLGTGVFVTFLLRLVVAPRKFSKDLDRFAAPLALVPIFIAFSLAGTTSEYGLLAAVLFGLQSVRGARHRQATTPMIS